MRALRLCLEFCGYLYIMLRCAMFSFLPAVMIRFSILDTICILV